ncbi:MAG TPA: aminoacyl-tRNA hydrolase [Patescibacteria group bacterium]|nr:aminoacyl-tRNA hydrolase [Patescibacteria group bacterium]
MILIVGLGNPGEQYEKTRHNLGFMVLEHFLKDFEQEKKTEWENSAKFKSDIAQINWQPQSSSMVKVILVKPKTYMNNSGMAVSLLTSFYKVKPSDIWIIHDDFDLPLGSMRIRFGGASAGHHGIDSIIQALGTDRFWRFRLGTGLSHSKGTIAKKTKGKGEDFVLGSFGKGESGKLRELVKKASKAIESVLEDGFPKTMNRYNTK